MSFKPKTKKKIRATKVRLQLNPNAAGADIGARQIYVAINPDLDEEPVRVFDTFTVDLKKAVEWLKEHHVNSLLMEATGVYWIPFAELLEEAGIEVCLANPTHVKNIAGRKTDVKDSEWLQHLHSCGLVRAAFRPNAKIRALREVFRARDSRVRESSRHVLRMHKALDEMNIQLHHVISDITGVSGVSIVEAILAGERDPARLAALGHETLRASKATLCDALTANYQEAQLHCLRQSLEAWRFAMKQIQADDAQLCRMLTELNRELQASGQNSQVELSPNGQLHPPVEEVPAVPVEASSPAQKRPLRERKRKKGELNYDARSLVQIQLGVDLTTIPGISALSAQALLAELGSNLDSFATSKHFISWLSLNPNNKITGGHVQSRHTNPSHNRVARILRTAAQGLHHAKNEMGDYYRRMRGKLGPAAGLVATAHKLGRLIYAMIKSGKDYSSSECQRSDKQRIKYSIRSLKEAAKRLGLQLVPEQQVAN
jgi:transposase